MNCRRFPTMRSLGCSPSRQVNDGSTGFRASARTFPGPRQPYLPTTRSSRCAGRSPKTCGLDGWESVMTIEDVLAAAPAPSEGPLVRSHPRGRVGEEERHALFPGKVVPPIYRALFSRLQALYLMSDGAASPSHGEDAPPGRSAARR